MNTSELYQLTTWMKNNNEELTIEHCYEHLIDAIGNYSYNSQPFEQQREDLFSTLKSVSLKISSLSQEQINFLDKLHLVENLGMPAIDKIEDILFRNVIDRETAKQKISDMFKEVKNGIDKLNSIRASLTGLVDGEQYELDNEVLMRIGFMGDVSMNNVEDFKKLGTLWFDIARGISMAQGKAPKDIKIIGATKGSVILELALNAALVSSFLIIIIQGLTVTEKIYTIKKIKAEAKIADMKLDFFDEKIAEIMESSITTIFDNLCNELKLNGNNQGDKKTALKKSITKLVGFLEQGGDVDFVMKEELESEDNKTKLLRSKIIEIRKLEEKILLLENKK
jgi:hypothetical protein